MAQENVREMMGATKEWLMEMQEVQYEESRAEWIRRELNDDDADETTEGWQELVDQYDKTIRDYEDAIYDEYSWYHDQDYSNALISFQQSINDIESILRSNINPTVVDTIYKMSYVHMVTVLETYLADTLKFLVFKNDQYLANAVKNLKEIKDRSLKPIDVFLDKKIVEKIVTEQLSKYLYHDVVKVLEIYKHCLDFKNTYELKEVIHATAVRHDLVHRNGKRKDGTSVQLDLNQLKSSLASIKNFVRYLDKELLDYREKEAEGL